MGDRCQVTVLVHQADRDAFVKIVGDPSEELLDNKNPRLITLKYEEANHALASELYDAAQARLRLLAYNGPGVEYNNGGYVSFAGESVYIDTDMDGSPVVTVPIDPADLKEAKKFIDLRDRLLEVPE